MKKIIIIGCGFAGLAALRILSREKQARLIVIDKKTTFDFLPMLPDHIGRNISADSISVPLFKLFSNSSIELVNQQVSSIDISKKQVKTQTRVFDYDYCLVASGAQTAFYGNKSAEKFAFSLDSVKDASRLRDAIMNKDVDTCVISGAGYTGIEAAVALSVFFKKRGIKKRVILVEKATTILGPLPEWMKEYVGVVLNDLGVEVNTANTVEEVDAERLRLSNGKLYEKAVLVWVSGVKTADFIDQMAVPKCPKGRLLVDEYLRVSPACFAAGDCSCVQDAGAPLRMAVQFSISQGELSALNIRSLMLGLELKRYRPYDLGYIVPLSNNKSCGRVLGVNIKGKAGILLHYMMCLYRMPLVSNKLDLCRQLFSGRSA